MNRVHPAPVTTVLLHAMALCASSALAQPPVAHVGAAAVSGPATPAPCSYELRQLTRADAGMSQVDMLLSIERKTGSAKDCSEDQWTVVAHKKDDATPSATGVLTIAEDIARVTWETLPVSTPNVPSTYELGFSDNSGQAVVTTSTTHIVIGPALDPVVNLRAFTAIDGTIAKPGRSGLLEVTDRNALAAGHENRVELNALQNPQEWSITVIGASSYFATCDEQEKPGNRLCLSPSRPTDELLKVRATRKVRAQDALLASAKPDRLGDLKDKELNLGFVEFSTGLSVKPYRLAADLAAHTKIVCGATTIDAKSFGKPISVKYDDFKTCSLVFEVDEGSSIDEWVRHHGEQRLTVSAGLVPVDKSAPKIDTLAQVDIASGGDDDKSGARATPRRSISVPLNMEEAAGGDADAYAIVQIEVKHVQDEFYVQNSPQSKRDSRLVVRVRRRPEFFTMSSNSGQGARFYGTFTIAPFSLFRAPHSGRNAVKSSDVRKLEYANFGFGLLGVVEGWDFNRNSPWVPFLSPQLQVGMVSTVPSATSLDYPALSFVAGIGLRTGIDTSPDAAVESSLKALFWYEHLWTFDGSRADESNNFLFGFGAEIGTFGN